MTKGEGSYLTLGDGRTMLDFTTGIGVTNLGPFHSLFIHHHANQNGGIVSIPGCEGLEMASAATLDCLVIGRVLMFLKVIAIPRSAQPPPNNAWSSSTAR